MLQFRIIFTEVKILILLENIYESLYFKLLHSFEKPEFVTGWEFYHFFVQNFTEHKKFVLAGCMKLRLAELNMLDNLYYFSIRENSVKQTNVDLKSIYLFSFRFQHIGVSSVSF